VNLSRRATGSRGPLSTAELELASDPDTVSGIHAHLRRLILDGHFPPGSTLSQVQLAQTLGISRTPLREALRRLQEEGLIVAQVNRRARVVGLDANELETLYATRILLSALGLSVTMPRFTAGDFKVLERALADMHQASEDDNIEGWEQAHHHFHERLAIHANPSLRESINRLVDRSDLYRRVGLKIDPHRWPASDEDHVRLLEACRQGDRDRAVEILARHSARTALTVMAQQLPEHEPATIRSALQIVLGLHAPEQKHVLQPFAAIANGPGTLKRTRRDAIRAAGGPQPR
jgi:DNA-binding GntR family transcriptional regulator